MPAGRQEAARATANVPEAGDSDLAGDLYQTLVDDFDRVHLTPASTNDGWEVP